MGVPLMVAELWVFALWGPDLLAVLVAVATAWWLAAGGDGFGARVAHGFVGPVAAALTVIATSLVVLNDVDMHASPQRAAEVEDAFSRIRFWFDRWTGSSLWLTLLAGTVVIVAQATWRQLPVVRSYLRVHAVLTSLEIALIFLTSFAIYAQPMLQRAVAARHGHLQQEFVAGWRDKGAHNTKQWVDNNLPPPNQRPNLATLLAAQVHADPAAADAIVEAASGGEPIGEPNVGPLPESEKTLAREEKRVRDEETTVGGNVMRLVKETALEIVSSKLPMVSEMARASLEQVLAAVVERYGPRVADAAPTLRRVTSPNWIREWSESRQRPVVHPQAIQPGGRDGGLHRVGLLDRIRDFVKLAGELGR